MIRDDRQQEFAKLWIEKGQWGILNLCPRFGKIYTTINILEMVHYDRVLIAYPDVKIKEAWQSDILKRGYSGSDITYTTHMSLKKLVNERYDLIVLDEIHLLSPAQVSVVREMKDNNKVILGLTGTLSSWTKKDLMMELHLPVTADYSIAQAISEGVIADYDITVVKVPLDNTVLQLYKKVRKTEKSQFGMLTMIINKMQSTGGDTMFMRLARMRIIQNSIAKRNATVRLLTTHFCDRVLVFCGVTAIADDLGIPSYHSKSIEKKIFENFSEGKGNHLAVVKIGNSGITYKPLNFVIINYFDSNAERMAQRLNRCMGMEYDNPDKKAHIFIISSTESIELSWLSKALEFFSKEKITYIDL